MNKGTIHRDLKGIPNKVVITDSAGDAGYADPSSFGGAGVTPEQLTAALGDYLRLHNEAAVDVTVGEQTEFRALVLALTQLYFQQGESISGVSKTARVVTAPNAIGSSEGAIMGFKNATVTAFERDGQPVVQIAAMNGTDYSYWEFYGGRMYIDGVEFTAGGGSTTLYSSRGQQTDGAPTNKLLDDSLKQFEPEIKTLTITAGAVTVPMSKHDDFFIASQPTTISVATGANSKLGTVVVVKFPANGTAAPTVSGAVVHEASRPFKTTSGTTNQLRIWSETNVSGAKTNYYIWT